VFSSRARALSSRETARQWTADPIDEPAIEVEEPLIDLSEELAGLSDEEDSDLFDGEPVGVYTIALEPDEPTIDTFDLKPNLGEQVPAFVQAQRGVGGAASQSAIGTCEAGEHGALVLVGVEHEVSIVCQQRFKRTKRSA